VVDNPELTESLALELLRCETARQARGPLSAEEWPGLTVADAYRIQDASRRHRESRGERVVGVKMGLTSRAKQKTMNVDEPVVAWVTDAMQLPLNQPIQTDRYIHPRVEPELFFRLGAALTGPGVTKEEAAGAIDAVVAGVDVIDSRYHSFAFTLPDVIADNASSAGFILGPIMKPIGAVDLELEAVLVEVDGIVVDSATATAVLGHPLEAVAAAANLLGQRGLALAAGDWVLAGAMTDAVALTGGQSVSFHFSTLGSIHMAKEE